MLQVLASSLAGPGPTMLGHSAAVSSLDWARTGHWLVSAGQDNSVKAGSPQYLIGVERGGQNLGKLGEIVVTF